MCKKTTHINFIGVDVKFVRSLIIDKIRNVHVFFFLSFYTNKHQRTMSA